MEKEELLKLTEQFIYSKLDSLKIQYFDIYYSKKIQPEIYESTENIIKYINKIVEASKELDNQNNNSNLIKNYENEFGFCFDNNIGNILYYLEQSKIENHKIEIYNEINEKVINNYLDSFNIPKELICFTSYNGSSNNSSNKSDKKNETNFDLNKEQTNKNIINYINGKKFENISIERFNYSLNLEENLIGLTQLPNILLFLLSYNNLIKIDNLMENLKFKNNDNKDIINELKNKLNYSIEYFGYNELDSIFKNDINKKREFRLFNFFKCKKIFEIKKGNKLEKENINSDYIKPYTINFLEIKKSLKYIKENNYIKKFLIKSRRFSQIFEKKKLNIITNPLIYDIDIKDINFPKKMEYELFLIINNNEDEIKNNVDEIIKQIDEFLQDFKDFDFDLHMYYSNLNFHPSELNLINKSRNINYNTLIYQTSKIYHDIQEKIVKLEKSNLNLEKSNLNLEKSNLNLEKSNLNLEKSNLKLEKSNLNLEKKQFEIINEIAKNIQFEKYLSNYLDRIFPQIKEEKSKYINVLIIGESGIGKSILINCFLNINKAKEGIGEAITQKLGELYISESDQNKDFKLFDSYTFQKMKIFQKQLIILLIL